MYRRPRFGFFPFIIFLPLFMFGGLFNFIFSLIPIVLLVVLGIYLLRIIVTAIAKRKKDNGSSFTKKSNDDVLSKALNTYFKENKEFPISTNVTLLAQKYDSFNDLFITYKGKVVDKFVELTDVNNASFVKVSNLLDDYSTRGKVCLKAELKSFDYNVSKDKKAYKEEYTNAGTLTKAQMKEVSGDFDYVYDAYKNLIENVSYGNENSKDYVKGHKAALDKCFDIVYEINSNIFEAEEKISNELESYESTTIEDKGYYDGLFYSLKAIKKAKEYMLGKISKEINKEL